MSRLVPSSGAELPRIELVQLPLAAIDAQLAAAPRDAGWTTRVIVDSATGLAVCCAGFHGPPDSAGMVELGYSVDPGLRRRGYARAALELLLAWAAREPAVTTVRATISPDNEASRNLVLQYGFAENGSQWDEDDGLEIIFEVARRRRTRTPINRVSAAQTAAGTLREGRTAPDGPGPERSAPAMDLCQVRINDAANKYWTA